MDYCKAYNQLIIKAMFRVNEGYTEQHHIIPKAEGGNNKKSNLVNLTAREHYIAHWLLFKLYKSPAMAKAFTLMSHTLSNRRSKDYAKAKEIMSISMRGENNVSRRPCVRAKLILAAQTSHPYRGKKRPEHSEVMKQKGHWAKENNPWFGNGARQEGDKNHRARAVHGISKAGDKQRWGTLQEAANFIGVSVQAVCQALKKNFKAKGWVLGYIE